MEHRYVTMRDGIEDYLKPRIPEDVRRQLNTFQMWDIFNATFDYSTGFYVLRPGVDLCEVVAEQIRKGC